MIRGRKLCDSRLFAAPPSFYKKYFLPFSSSINDSHQNYFEHVLFEATIHWTKCNKPYREFFFPLLFVGTTGSTGKKIVNSKFPYITSIVKFIMHKLGIYINRK